jgi:hypothetical protein
MILIILKVRKIELRIQRYAGGRSNQLERTTETGRQALLYIAAFFLTFFPLVMMQIMYTHRGESYYFIFAVWAFSPLQGVLNACITLVNGTES